MGFSTEMDSCGKMMKYFLFGVNLIIFLAGLATTGLAIYSLADNVTWISEITGSNLLTGTVYVILICGILITLISFLGCLGALREIRCMLVTYFLIVFLLFVILLVGGILGYVFRQKFVDTLQVEMRSSMRLYDQRRDIRAAWDTVQSQLHCCGVNSWRDWSNSGYRVPKSCCREAAPGVFMHCDSTVDSVTPTNTYTWGCLNQTENFLKQHATQLGTAGLIAALLMFLGMVFSFALFKLIG